MLSTLTVSIAYQNWPETGGNNDFIQNLKENGKAAGTANWKHISSILLAKELEI